MRLFGIIAGGVSCSSDEFSSAVTSNGYTAPGSDQYAAFSNNIWAGGFSTKRELAMFLAECIWESGGLAKKTEDNPQAGAYVNPSLVQALLKNLHLTGI